MKRQCIERQPGREKQIAEEGTVVPRGLSPAGESPGPGEGRQEGGQGMGGHHRAPPLLFLHRRAPNPSPASIVCINL